MTPPQKTLSEFFKEKYKQLPPPKKINNIPKKHPDREKKKFVKTMMYGLTAPLVFGPGTWGETFPQDMTERGRMLRLASAIKCIDHEMCTLFDAMAYMYSISFEAPLRHDAMKMYMYLYKHSVPEKWKILVESDPEYERYSELYDNEMQEVNQLRRWIFRRQISSIM
ncbi:MAG: hypothetical protein K5785_00895 [Nitrosarchaeum sp.]|nr:hypothetical protein [Nitrosarchaeum sp.]